MAIQVMQTGFTLLQSYELDLIEKILLPTFLAVQKN